MTETPTSGRFDYGRVLVLLTGRHIRRLDYVLATFLFSVVVHISNAQDLESMHNQHRFIALIAAQVATVAFMLLLTSFIKQSRLTTPIRAWLLLAYPAAAAIRGFTLNYTLFAFGTYAFDLATLRAFASLSTATIGYIALAFMFGLKAEWSEESSRQLQMQDQLRSLLTGATNRLERHIKTDVAKVRETLQAKLEALATRQPQEVADGLRGIMDEVLRPKVSELLAIRDNLKLREVKLASRKFKWGQLVQFLSLRYSAAPLAISAALIATYGPFLAISEGPLRALTTGVIGTPMLFLGLFAVSRLLSSRVDRLPEWPRLAAIIGSLILATLPYHAVYYVTMPVSGTNVWLPSLATLGTLVVGTITGFSGAANNQLTKLARQLQSDAYRLKWQVAELQGRDWYLQQQFARKLHGPIQAELAAATIRIERKISKGGVNPAAVAEIQQDLVGKLNILLSTDSVTPNLAEVLGEMRETWDGIADIEFTVNPAAGSLLAKDPIAVETALEIVREACSNAIRHGKSDEIRVNISEATQDSVTIEIADNGSVHDGSGPAGLGTKYLTDCTIENSRQASDSGSVLTAVIPVRA